MLLNKKRFSVGYILPVSVIYVLPFFALPAFVIIGSIFNGIPPILPVVIGSSVVGGMIFFPFFAVYYAAISAVHTIIDQIFFCRIPIKWRALSVLISLLISVFLTVSSLFLFFYFDHKYSWIALICMALGLILVFGFLVIRIVCEAAFESSKRKIVS